MNICKRMVFGFFLVVWIWSMLNGNGYGQVQSTAEVKEVSQPTGNNNNQTIETLDMIYQAISQAKKLLAEKGKELKSAQNEEQKISLIAEIKEIKDKIERLEKDFEKIASGVDLDQFYATPKGEFDWQKEVQELMNPIIHELKSMTEKPRQIEKLRTEITFYENRIPVLSKAIENVDQLISIIDNAALKKYLEEVKSQLAEKKQHHENQLRIFKYQLEEKIKDKKSVLESMQKLFQSFFKTRGRNFLIALIGFITTFLFLRLLGKQIFKRVILKKIETTSVSYRAMELGYQIVTVIGAFCTSIIILYASGDWVLLSLLIIFLLGIGWTARQGIPRFSENIKIMLNLGNVRENERIVYNGLSWKVVSLNMFTTLENPVFQIGKIRVPIHEIKNLVSRPYNDSEPWFPCNINDWVILSDNSYGQVVVLTPETVQIVLPGGSRKSYQTQDFLSQNPINLSTNFRINVTFGIDYAHQAICTTDVPEKLQNRLVERLHFHGYKDYINKIKVDFKAAGASSLDYAVIVDFFGSAAPFYNDLNRLIQKICVDACNEYGWIIPFTQVTIHEAASSHPKPDTEKLFQKSN